VGRLVESVTEIEPEWDDAERAWAIALLEVVADTCPDCGQPRDESTHEDAEGAYEADLPTRCHACTALHKAMARYSESDPGLQFEVRRRRPINPGVSRAG
jgi:hypothetical protein